MIENNSVFYLICSENLENFDNVLELRGFSWEFLLDLLLDENQKFKENVLPDYDELAELVKCEKFESYMIESFKTKRTVDYKDKKFNFSVNTNNLQISPKNQNRGIISYNINQTILQNIMKIKTIHFINIEKEIKFKINKTNFDKEFHCKYNTSEATNYLFSNNFSNSSSVPVFWNDNSIVKSYLPYLQLNKPLFGSEYIKASPQNTITIINELIECNEAIEIHDNQFLLFNTNLYIQFINFEKSCMNVYSAFIDINDIKCVCIDNSNLYYYLLIEN